MITPPWTLPATFASVTSIICVRVTFESETLRGPRSDTRGILRGLTVRGRRTDTIATMRRTMRAFAVGGRGRRLRRPATVDADPHLGVADPEPDDLEPTGLTRTIRVLRPLAEPRASPTGRCPGRSPTISSPPSSPLDALVPEGADATGQWFGFTANGVVVLVAWAEPGSDPFLMPRGFALWRRHASSPHWRVGLVERHAADEGIQEIQMSTTDLTGDHSDDALIFEGIGGSGACGTWLVLDLARVKEIYRRELCDGRIDPGPPGSPGLVMTRIRVPGGRRALLPERDARDHPVVDREGVAGHGDEDDRGLSTYSAVSVEAWAKVPRPFVLSNDQQESPSRH